MKQILNSNDFESLTKLMSRQEGKAFVKMLQSLRNNCIENYIITPNLTEYDRGNTNGYLRVVDDISNNLLSKIESLPEDINTLSSDEVDDDYMLRMIQELEGRGNN
jgi:hypothetical protein